MCVLVYTDGSMFKTGEKVIVLHLEQVLSVDVNRLVINVCLHSSLFAQICSSFAVHERITGCRLQVTDASKT